MADYKGAQARALAALRRASGGDNNVFTVTRKGELIMDADGIEHQLPDASFDLVGVVTQYRLTEIGETVQRGDMKFIGSAQQALKNGDQITVDGTAYRVQDPGPIKPGGQTTIVHIAQLRKA